MLHHLLTKTSDPSQQHNHLHSSYKHLKHISASSSSSLQPHSSCKCQYYFSKEEDKQSLYNSMNHNINNNNNRLLMNNVGENEIHFFSSSVPKDKRSLLLNMHYEIEAKNKKRKKNKKKKRKGNHHNNIFGIENIPQNRYYIDKERKRRERKNKFEGLIVIKKLTHDNILEAQSMYEGKNPKLKLSLDIIKENAKRYNNNNNVMNVNNSSSNDKPVSTSRKNRFAYYSNKHNNNNISINSKSSTNLKNKNVLTHNVQVENKILNNNNNKTNCKVYNKNNYIHKYIPTCDNLSRSHANALILRLSMDAPFVNTTYTKTAIYKYETNKAKRAYALEHQISIAHTKSPPAKTSNYALKHSSSCGNYTRYQTAKAKHTTNGNSNNNININNNNNNSSSMIHNTNFVLNKPNSLNNITPNNKSINNRYSYSQILINKSTKSKPKPQQQQQSPEPISVIQSRKELAEKQSLNYKDFKSLLYCIVPGNASYLVKHCMSHRINWKETFSSSSSLFNFKWQQLSHGIDFASLSHIAYLRQIVNHYEYHTLISHKGNMFANLFKWCEDRNISVFKYVPFTIVHKILREDKDNVNKLKQEHLETFMTSNIERYVKKYEHIGVTRSYDPVETYADVFPWLQPSNKADKACEDVNKKKDKTQQQQQEHEVPLGKNTRIEIPSTHWCGKNMWVVKAANLNRGQCIRVVDSYHKMEKVIRMIQEGVEKDFTVAEIEDKEDNKVDDSNKKVSSSNNNGNSSVSPNAKEPEKKKYSSNKIIIQKYIESPLLYKGRKCDMRIWVLITHKMKVYVYKEGHLKTCSVDYNINSQDAFTHITNYSFQKYSDNFAKFEIGNEVPFHDFQSFIDECYPKRKYSIKEHLMRQVKEIVDITMKCAKAQINLDKRKYSFEIFGYDFMLDSEFNLFLIEINTNPGLEESSPWIKTIVPRMLDDALRLTIDVLFNTKYDHALNYKREKEGTTGLTAIIVNDKESESTSQQQQQQATKLQIDKTSKDDNNQNDDEDKRYISPFPVPGYTDDDNLWDFVCDLNDKDEYELQQEELERERQLKKEKEREAFYTGIKHLMQKRNTRKPKNNS